jgi:hypothetical protein
MFEGCNVAPASIAFYLAAPCRPHFCTARYARSFPQISHISFQSSLPHRFLLFPILSVTGQFKHMHMTAIMNHAYQLVQNLTVSSTVVCVIVVVSQI